MKRIAIPSALALLVFTGLFLFVFRQSSSEKTEESGEKKNPGIVQPAPPNSESTRSQMASATAAESFVFPEPARGPARIGIVDLTERIDRFVSHFESGPADEVAFDVELLGEDFAVALTEFERVPGSAGSGVFFGYIEGQPHSRVSWAFHGEAEVGEIQVHGQNTLKIIPTGSGREHRVQAWDPLELNRCALCLAQEQ